jgi:hypothetical protein
LGSSAGIQHGSYMVKVRQDSSTWTPGKQCIVMLVVVVVVVVVVVLGETFAPSRDPSTPQDRHEDCIGSPHFFRFARLGFRLLSASNKDNDIPSVSMYDFSEIKFTVGSEDEMEQEGRRSRHTYRPY